jgi:hypothetical protein
VTQGHRSSEPRHPRQSFRPFDAVGLAARRAVTFDFLEVEAQSTEDFSPIPVAELLPQFVESKVDYVVMMDLLGGNIITEFEPDIVQ